MNDLRLPTVKAENAPTVFPVKVLNMTLPRRLTALHQIEITSHCNLRCVYCPSPNLKRPKVHMTEDHFDKALVIAKRFYEAGTQRELNLAGIGESTLHPQFVDFVRKAREALGPVAQLIFATNGVGYGEELIEAVKPYNPKVYVSLHRPEKAARTMQLWDKHGLLCGVSVDPSLNAMTWAGQVDWIYTQSENFPCMWIRQGIAMAMADGRITQCCYDASGVGVIGHVDDDPNEIRCKPYELCKTCHQQIAIEGYNQHVGI